MGDWDCGIVEFTQKPQAWSRASVVDSFRIHCIVLKTLNFKPSAHIQKVLIWFLRPSKKLFILWHCPFKVPSGTEMERAEEPDLFRRHVLTATSLEQDITLLYYTGNPLLHSSYRTKKPVFEDPDPNVLGLPDPEPEVCIRLRVRLGSFPFLVKVLSWQNKF